MQYLENIPLSTLTTMRLGGLARYVVKITATEDLKQAIQFAEERGLPWFVLGGGSNVVALGDYRGLIILNRITAFKKLREDSDTATYQIGAGEVWDSVVERLVQAGLSGVEAMSGIPGFAGSTPIQNVGAYGQEIADTLVELSAFDSSSQRLVTLSPDDCAFTYRNSIFKNPETRHHVIVSITLRLSKIPMQPPFYPSLQQYLTDHQLTDYSPAQIRAAVPAIRAERLPDLNYLASAGSFFKNPIVQASVAYELLRRFPDMPHWEAPGQQFKLAAGWLIDQAGLRSYSAHGLQIYPHNALVVTNISAQSGEDLLLFKSEVVAVVREMFGITLEQEPETLPS
ncbi:MAG: UDP-N-acetylmuramate dehydrogenase [Coriobacteriales bacterium]|jgi:UDP-N-acetylmuramate dehydrogenase|nr:UDP-N-acetylmuramate dehydrogenase [Coriobacteriales bacterium]